MLLSGWAKPVLAALVVVGVAGCVYLREGEAIEILHGLQDLACKDLTYSLLHRGQGQEQNWICAGKFTGFPCMRLIVMQFHPYLFR